MNAAERRQIEGWLADEVDTASATELEALLARADGGDPDADADLADRFVATLTFGTAGLRGPLRAGPNGMNRVVVRRAAAGIAAWLAGRSPGAVVVIGYDARHRSHDFAHDSAAVLAAAGFDARVLPEPLPTPVLAYSVLALGAAAGVMVTASHNPPQDNGYKVYAADGGQIVSPIDAEIETAIRAVGPARAIPLATDYTVLDDSVVAGYVDAVAGLVGPPRADLRIVHTALHGVGTAVVRRAFVAAGYPTPDSVAAQAAPDADFPTVAFPNPEEPGAIDLSLDLARSEGADLVIANDPDADRCAVAVEFPDTGWRMLRGDEVGILLADALIRKGIRGTYATTVVSSTMLRALCAARGVGYAETLTGFKWISRAAPDLVYGYEEALGYAVAPALVRDKDGISAALTVAELASGLRADGSSIPRRLAELSDELGWHVTDQVSVRVEDLSLIADVMARLRQSPPATLLERAVTVTDRLPGADVLTFDLDGGRVVVRPSGTEPKLKAYLEVVARQEETARSNLRALRDEVSALVAP
jgi:phosphomannomutase